MTTHEDYREALALHALGSLERAERQEVDAHLETCPRCLAELAELREAVANLVLLAKPLEPAPRQFERLLEVLPARVAATSSGTSTVVSVPAPPAPFTLRALLKSKRFTWGARFAVAAVLVLLTISQINLLERLDRAYFEIARMREIGEFVTSPGVSLVPLWGTDVARGAHAKLAYEEATGRFMLFSSRMPAPPAGRRYQLWVISDRVRPATFAPGSHDGTLRALPRGDEPFFFGMSLEPETAAEADEPRTDMVLMSPPVRRPR